MPAKPPLDTAAATELHNRLTEKVLRAIVEEPLAAGGSMSDIMMLCESVLVGVMIECFQLGSDVKMLDVIVGRVKERLAKVRLEGIETRGSG